MDITKTITPRSDQQNYDDYIAGPRTVTVAKVSGGSAEQPVNIELVEYPGRPYKPNLSMRRVLFKIWGSDTDAYTGRRLKLVGNPDVSFGGQKVGGIEIGALSNIDKPVTVSLTTTRAKRRPFTVQPLIESDNPQPPAGWRDRVENAQTSTSLQQLYDEEAHLWFTPEVRLAFTARKKFLETPL